MFICLEIITLSEISPSEKDKHHMISLLCGIYGTKETDKQKKPRSVDVWNSLTDLRGEGLGLGKRRWRE